MIRGERAERREGGSGASARTAQRLPADARERLDAYLDLLAKWNRVYNLTAIRERRHMESQHVNDALAVLPFLPDAPCSRLLDVGSGGGIPGIPLAIARPDWRVVLLDANTKKATFLTQAAIELGLANVRVVASRVEQFAPGAPFDVVISRAFSDLPTFALAASRLAAADGIIVAMKGALPADEIAALPNGVVVTATPALVVPGLDARRHLVIMRAARSGGPAR
ncbi:MAG TPA: 16S rRNA (guanine(527)-N(7))-methyltransferase RsmG [Casimicrobiaceae bacterium]